MLYESENDDDDQNGRSEKSPTESPNRGGTISNHGFYVSHESVYTVNEADDEAFHHADDQHRPGRHVVV